MEFTKTMLMRRSCRAYSDVQLHEDMVQALLESANLAPVGRKKYDEVHLTVVQNKQFLADWTGEHRQRVGDPNVSPFYGAPTVIVVSVKSPDGEPPLVAMANAACAVDHMHLRAADLGLGSVYIYGATTVLRGCPALMARLGLPEGFVPASSLAVGYSLEEELPPRTPERLFTCNELR